MTLPCFTDEKLEEYLGIWNKLNDRKILDITLTMDFGSFAWPSLVRYTLAYGEEKRELTLEQAWRVKDWLNSLGQGGQRDESTWRGESSCDI
jgi:hypothetical protein